MNRFIKHFFYIFLFLLFSAGQVFSQSEEFDKTGLDSIELRYGKDLCDTLPELVDSIFIRLKTKKFDLLIPYMPTADMLKEQFDSMDMTRLQRLAEVKQQYWVHNLRKQHIRMIKDAKVMRFNMRNMVVVKQRLKIKEVDPGVRFGEVTLLCESGKRRAYVTFLAMELVDKWFIGDELKIIEVGP